MFEPGLIAALYDAGRAACSLADMRAAKESGAVTALREVLGTPDGLGPDGLDTAVEHLRRGAAAADSTGRPLHAGLTALSWPDDRWAGCGTPARSCASTGATRTWRPAWRTG